MDAAALARFWAWWVEAGPRIATAIDARSVHEAVDEISAQVKALDAGLAWELGPGQRSRHAFTLSPEGNIVLRRLTERWVRSAPTANESWEYYPARQPALTRSLTIGGQEFKPADWLFEIAPDPERLLLDLAGYHPNLRRLPETERPRAGFIALDQMFGEDAVEKWLGGVEFTTNKPRHAAGMPAVMKTIGEMEIESKTEVFTLAQGTDRGGRPLFLNFNPRLKRLDHLFAETRIQVDMSLQQPTDQGLTTNAEAEALNLLEDQLLAAAEPILFVGRLTGQGKRRLYFYSEDPDRTVETLRARLAANSNWQHQLLAQPDPEWAFYREGIFQQFAPRR